MTEPPEKPILTDDEREMIMGFIIFGIIIGLLWLFWPEFRVFISDLLASLTDCGFPGCL